MQKRRDSARPNDERVRFTGGRAPDSRADATNQPDAPEADWRLLQSDPDPMGRCRVTTGFELVSCAIPARAQRADLTHTKSDMPAAMGELQADIHVAFAPFLAELPEGAALIAEYRFSPAGEGSVEVRFRLLVETARLQLTDAIDEALRARDELGVCLRVLSAWYAFSPVEFSPDDKQRWHGAQVQLRVKPRLFAADSSKGIGFAEKEQKSNGIQLLLPQPASGDVHWGRTRNEPRPLLLEGSRQFCLAATIRAARGLTAPLAVRVGLRRRNFDPAVMAALLATPDTLSAAAHGESAMNAFASGTGRAREAAQNAVDQLVIQPQSVELFVEADGTRDQSLALLRILGRELIPDFSAEVTKAGRAATKSGASRRNNRLMDISQLFAPGAPMPPLLPAPSELEAISFRKHFANPTVVFAKGGLRLGSAQIGGVVVDVAMPQADRSRHTYVLGATGTGKSTLLYNMAVQDMKAGHGVAVIDPHGDLYEQLLLAVPPERKRDLLLIDPEDDRFCPGLNPLDFGGKPDVESVSRVANDMLDVFESLYDMRQAGGPGFEDYFRNSILLSAAASRGGPSASDGPIPSFSSIVHVLRDADWRNICIARLDDVYGKENAEQIQRFFKMAEATTGDQKFANWVPYISSKLTRFVTNATLRKMFCRGKRTLNFRSAMDQRKIVLVNLGKGDLGGSDSRLIGMLLTKYLFQAALSRSDIPREERLPFYFYLDEFQNFVATDIPEMLAESRKYGLHMVLANQTLGQLLKDGRRETLDAVLGNVATKLFMRVGLQEAAAVAAGFAPHFNAETLTQLPDRHVLCTLQMRGQPSLPFVFETLAPATAPVKAQIARSKGWAASEQALSHASGQADDAGVSAETAHAVPSATLGGSQKNVVTGDSRSQAKTETAQSTSGSDGVGPSLYADTAAWIDRISRKAIKNSSDQSEAATGE